MKARLLLVDDDKALCETLEADLRDRGHDVRISLSVGAAEAALADSDFDVVVTDLAMPSSDGLALCRHVVANRPDIPVVVLTAFGSLDSAVGAIRAGAYDFLSKPIELDALAIALDRAANHKRLREEVKRLRQEVARTSMGDLVGQSPAMKNVFDLVARVADSEATVLVSGESGVGKELVARAIHAGSSRSAEPFVAINCAAIPATLLESELFGHARGAFTDAKVARQGLFAQARGGTLFLDEIGDMPLELQPKLLRVLQDRTVRPVGGSEIPIDVRVIAATNRDLESAIEEERFREDLYYRINVVQIPVPPLRARPGDVLPLAMHFAHAFAAREKKAITGIAPAAGQRLVAYAWPGNVRELQNCIERAVALARFDQLTLDDLPEKVRDYTRSHVLVVSDDPSELVPMEEVERRYVARVMEAVGGNKTAAARVLGFDRKRLYRMLERLGLDKRIKAPSSS